MSAPSKNAPDDHNSLAGLSFCYGALGEKAKAVDATRTLFRHRPIFARQTEAAKYRVLVLEYLYDGHFVRPQWGANIFRYRNFTSGFKPDVLALNHYHLNRDDPAGDLREFGRFDAVINNIANSERVEKLNLTPMIQDVVEAANAPVINPPEAVLASTRSANDRRLRGAGGFMFPRTVEIAIGEGESAVEEAISALCAEVPPPVILRPVRTHAGVLAVLPRTWSKPGRPNRRAARRIPRSTESRNTSWE